MPDAIPELMEARVHKLEEGMRALELKVEKVHTTLHEALLGTLDGKPGIVATLHSSLDASKQNSTKLDGLTTQVDGLRLDKSKVNGIVIGVSAIWAGLIAIAALAIRMLWH